MSDDIEVFSLSDGGISGSHSPTPNNPLRIGPTTEDQKNTFSLNVFPIACWRVEDVRFDFDSSFVRPEIAAEVADLASLRERHKIALQPRGNRVFAFPPISLFGHADPVGTDDYNKELSGRRATAIYGMLTRDVGLWEKLFSKPFHGDNWTHSTIQTMLTTLGFSASDPDGDPTSGTKEAVKNFQSAKQLPVDGKPGPATRAALFLAYMDKLCGEFRLDKKNDFLARGADPGGKGDIQGCSEFNPVLLFSRREEQDFSVADRKDDRDAANASNRRVMAFLFQPGRRVDPGKWPCPGVAEGVGRCLKRFWSDGEERRSRRLPDSRREFRKTEDTFACRFYQRLARGSPCERTIQDDVFRYGVEFGENRPWTDKATLRIVSEDGLQEKIFAKDDGVASGTHRVFTFANIREKVRYRADIRDQKHAIDLFGFVELHRIQDPADSLHILPLPEPDPVDPGPQSQDPVPSSLSGPAEGVDPENVAIATNPPDLSGIRIVI